MHRTLPLLQNTKHHTRLQRLARDDAAIDVDSNDIARELSAAIAGEVRFSAGGRALYATDGSNYGQAPIGVVLPHCGGCGGHGRARTQAGSAAAVAWGRERTYRSARVHVPGDPEKTKH